mmetsp:Transcript_55069/g.106287  ORF Transcript_55069/g.106287 Transcript_55069/m.106287 type:complete len:83 (-) Transcript_55069:3-251(-)
MAACPCMIGTAARAAVSCSLPHAAKNASVELVDAAIPTSHGQSHHAGQILEEIAYGLLPERLWQQLTSIAWLRNQARGICLH